MPGRRAAGREGSSPAFDISIACSGFIYGLTVASALIRSGVYRRVMLIGAETLSKILNKEDRVDRDPVRRRRGRGDPGSLRGELVSVVRTRRRRKPAGDALRQGSSGSRHPIDRAALDQKLNLIHMQGREVFKFAVTR